MMQEKYPETEKYTYLSEYEPVHLWGNVRLNNLTTLKSDPVNAM